MTPRPAHVSPYDDVLPAEEFERRVELARRAAQGPEGEEAAELVAWFLRRYPSPMDRLAYVRRKVREATSHEAGPVGDEELGRAQ